MAHPRRAHENACAACCPPFDHRPLRCWKSCMLYRLLALSFPRRAGAFPLYVRKHRKQGHCHAGLQGRVVGHGFRATFSTIANESGHFSPDIIERQLAHKERNEVRAAYHRAEYLPDRRKMMQWWADYLDEMRSRRGGYPVTLKKSLDYRA